MAKKTSTGAVVAEVGAGLAAAGAAAAAGYYFYASSDAKKHRKVAAKWANDMKNQVVKQAKKSAGTIDAKSVAAAVDSAMAAYQGVRSIDRSDLSRAAKELKANWKLIQAEAEKAGKKAAKSGRASAKKVAKRVVAKGKSSAKKAVSKAKMTVRKSAKKRQ